MKRREVPSSKRSKAANRRASAGADERSAIDSEPITIDSRAAAWAAGRFIIIVTVVFLASLLFWPTVSGTYRQSFIAISHTLFHSFGSDVRVQFARIDEDDGRDVSMKVRNLRKMMMLERHIPSRYSGYLPSALLIALTLATPLAWRRRLVALVVGLAALHVYIATVLLLTIVRMLSRDGPAQLYELPPFWDGLLENVVYQTTTSPTFSMLVPVVIWAAATFRRGDFERMGTYHNANTDEQH